MLKRELTVVFLLFAAGLSGCWDESDWYGGSGGSYGGGYMEGGSAGWPGGAGGAAGDTWGGPGGGALCYSNDDCGAGSVCSPLDGCEPIVADCPLTPECIGDPEGYTPEWQEWQGWDPLYAGAIASDGASWLADIHLDFYEGHVYGEGSFVLPDSNFNDFINVVITGIRDGDQLRGQFIEASGTRSFDAVYIATMPSASEIIGTVTFASDEGEWHGDMHLFRTSPCGCSLVPDGCTDNAQCAEGEVCLNAKCSRLCGSASDCPDPSHSCVDFVCQTSGPTDACDPPCADASQCQGGVCIGIHSPGEACAPQDMCLDGTECIDGVCSVPCSHSCDCPSGQVCSNGGCVTPSIPGPRPCESDCDCMYADGEKCVDGICEG